MMHHAFVPAGSNAISRRDFLRGAGVAMALPLLEAMAPRLVAADAAEAGGPRAMIAICNNLGLLPEEFFPKDAGSSYTPSPYLSLLGEHRKDLTVFSGMSHTDVDGGHTTDVCFLTGAPRPAVAGFRNTVSLDQYLARRLRQHTRFASLTLGVNTLPGTRSLSWTESGALIPCEQKASQVFTRLFMAGTTAEVAAAKHQLESGRSVLDAVAGHARRLQKTSTARDREVLERYFTSVRELEVELQRSGEWLDRAKPVVAEKLPVDPSSPREYMAKVRAMYRLARLAIETDSTRAVTLLLDSENTPAIDPIGDVRITDGYHNLSHHGRAEDKLAQLKAIDGTHMRMLSDLLAEMKAVSSGARNLLDRTMVLYGSNLGNSNTHATTNLPILLAGGGFKHGSHLAFDREKNQPLANLYVSMIRQFGFDCEKFSSSTGPVRGLDA